MAWEDSKTVSDGQVCLTNGFSDKTKMADSNGEEMAIGRLGSKIIKTQRPFCTAKYISIFIGLVVGVVAFSVVVYFTVDALTDNPKTGTTEQPDNAESRNDPTQRKRFPGERIPLSSDDVDTMATRTTERIVASQLLPDRGSWIPAIDGPKEKTKADIPDDKSSLLRGGTGNDALGDFSLPEWGADTDTGGADGAVGKTTTTREDDKPVDKNNMLRLVTPPVDNNINTNAVTGSSASSGDEEEPEQREIIFDKQNMLRGRPRPPPPPVEDPNDDNDELDLGTGGDNSSRADNLNTRPTTTGDHVIISHTSKIIVSDVPLSDTLKSNQTLVTPAVVDLTEETEEGPGNDDPGHTDGDLEEVGESGNGLALP